MADSLEKRANSIIEIENEVWEPNVIAPVVTVALIGGEIYVGVTAAMDYAV